MSQEDYECETCDVTFETEDEFKNHAREAHDADV